MKRLNGSELGVAANVLTSPSAGLRTVPDMTRSLLKAAA